MKTISCSSETAPDASASPGVPTGSSGFGTAPEPIAQVDDLARGPRHAEPVELLVEDVEALLERVQAALHLVGIECHGDLVALAVVAHVRRRSVISRVRPPGTPSSLQPRGRAASPRPARRSSRPRPAPPRPPRGCGVRAELARARRTTRNRQVAQTETPGAGGTIDGERTPGSPATAFACSGARTAAGNEREAPRVSRPRAIEIWRIASAILKLAISRIPFAVSTRSRLISFAEFFPARFRRGRGRG